MKRILAFILLLSHFNTSMFFPVVEEIDFYDSQGVQKNDINSVFEYIVKKVSNEKNTPASDEDDDQPDFIHIGKTVTYDLSRQFDFVLPFYQTAKKVYISFYQSSIPLITQEVASPPPDSFFFSHN